MSIEARYYQLMKSINWSPKVHKTMYCNPTTNNLFMTLFLAIQQLEEKDVLPLAHQAMFEDMLTFWTMADSRDIYDIKDEYRWAEIGGWELD